MTCTRDRRRRTKLRTSYAINQRWPQYLTDTAPPGKKKPSVQKTVSILGSENCMNYAGTSIVFTTLVFGFIESKKYFRFSSGA